MDSRMIRPVTISGANGQRTPWFSPAIGEVFAKKTLGVDVDLDWFNRAKREIEQYDSYVERLRHLANRQARESIWSEYVGDQADSESGAFRRNSVAWHISEAEAYTPVNYMVFAADAPGLRVRNRVTKLDSLNSSFKKDLDAAEATYGLLPDPQIVERYIEVRVPGAPVETSSFPIVPVLVVGGAVVLGLALLGVFSSKK